MTDTLATRAHDTGSAAVTASSLRHDPLYQAFWLLRIAYVVAAWLAGIIVNLSLIPGFYDVALRDFGLLLAALTLARLATVFPATFTRTSASN